MDHDVIVIGAGVAGLTAGYVAASHGLDTLVIDRMGVGGQVVNIEQIDNFPGFPDGIAGIELGPALQEQGERAGATFLLDEVEALEREGDGWFVRCAGAEVRARAVILATGSELRRLGVPGEEEFAGRGVSHCASCDGPLFRGEHVVVAGGGDSAVQEALALAPHVRKVTIVHDGPALTAQAVLRERLSDMPTVHTRPQAKVTRISGDQVVQTVTLEAGGADENVAAGGVFTYVGLAPNAALAAPHVTPDAENRLPVDAGMRLPASGLYAAGDVRAGSVCWLASAAGDGATAAISAVRDHRARD